MVRALDIYSKRVPWYTAARSLLCDYLTRYTDPIPMTHDGWFAIFVGHTLKWRDEINWRREHERKRRRTNATTESTAAVLRDRGAYDVGFYTWTLNWEVSRTFVQKSERPYHVTSVYTRRFIAKRTNRPRGYNAQTVLSSFSALGEKF